MALGLHLGLGLSRHGTSGEAPDEGGAYVGPLDLVSGAAVAYGQRALSAAKRGTALYTIRRDSDDAEQSFSSDATTGLAPVASITSFIGGANGFGAVWTDQSGNDKHGIALVVEEEEQPRWVASVQNSRPGFNFDWQVKTRFTTDDPVNIPSGQLTVFVVVQHIPLGGPSSNWIVGAENNDVPFWECGMIGYAAGDPATTRFQVSVYDADDNQAGDGFLDFMTPDIGVGVHLFEAAWEHGAGAASIDGAALTYSSNLDGPSAVGVCNQRVTVGASDSGGTNNRWSGNILEMIAYPTGLSSGDRALIRANIAEHYGITLA